MDVQIDDLPLIDDPTRLTEWLSETENEGKVVRTRLKASERVIARVTDGIYREPASSFRELVANAWDADATEVSILTDAPRFARIYIRDNGVGMSYETLSRLLHSIGGSAKRSEEGQRLGISGEDPDASNCGRPLIGKIGIGLFSVSQLARRFHIITKAPGTDYRLTAEVRLREYSEDSDEDIIRESDDSFVSGEVFITREHTDDRDARGTDIVLEDIKPRVRDLLRSADRWRALDERDLAVAQGDLEAVAGMRVQTPTFHAGWISELNLKSEKTVVLARAPKLPWSSDDLPEVRMSKLVDAVEQQFSRMERPDLKTTLDAYLETLWKLALAIPVRYVDKHPFDLTAADDVRVYWISNQQRGQALELALGPADTVRSAARQQAPGKPSLEDGGPDPAGGFRVIVDGVELRRPVRFRFFKTERRGLDKSLLLVGKYAPDLSRVDRSLRGGDLALEAYLFWNGRIVPKENNGVLIRIRGASGALFDPTFFNYQISELTRLRQITSELFIKEGLDAALNIDRESFNFSHPHVQLVSSWLHRAIRQLTNRLKELSGKAREGRRADDVARTGDALVAQAEIVWKAVRGAEPVPEVEIANSQEQAEAARRNGFIAVQRDKLPTMASIGLEQREREARTKALLIVLAAYRVLDEIPYDEQHALLDAMLKVFYTTI